MNDGNPLLSLKSLKARTTGLESSRRRAWPPMLEAFYTQFEQGAGWIGEWYISMYPVSKFDLLNNRAEFDPRWAHITFFATDGAGETFGYLPHQEAFTFVMAPAIGSFEDTINLGSESEFIDHLSRNTVFDAPKLGLRND